MSKLTVPFVAVGGLIALAGLIAVVIGGLTELEFSGALFESGIGAVMIGLGLGLVGWALGALLRPGAAQPANESAVPIPTAPAAAEPAQTVPEVAQPALGVGVGARPGGYLATASQPGVPVATGPLPVVGGLGAYAAAAQIAPVADPAATGQFPAVGEPVSTATGPFLAVGLTTGAIPIVGGADAPTVDDDDEDAVFAVDWAEAGGPPRARGTYVAPTGEEEEEPATGEFPAPWGANAFVEHDELGGLDPELERTMPLDPNDEYGPYRRR
ncbi:hypothetical protein [Agromyces seonyuensis]|uniref:Uncharacterized protein n=1 Tax=Agromyces seonyuensis TaxID=2662446 RepID=A0A6I4NVK0_9MICO|nr:hypothetical protein [Agromyces seonyuensis]MWB98466.1 hypothetical protein [Agromyces seonyuensis]